MFCTVQSPVSLLSRTRCDPSKIIASANDGSIRLLSPVTGMCLSIIYPFANCKVRTSNLFTVIRNVSSTPKVPLNLTKVAFLSFVAGDK